MRELVVATRSAHKLAEIKAILVGVPDVRVLGLDEAGVAETPEEDDLEPFETFEENALSKARHFFRRTGRPTVADDSGLEVEALGWGPGVRTKRFAPAQHLEGEALDRANVAHLLERLGGLAPERRRARYVCVAALVTEDGERVFRGEARGWILDQRKGTGGFGYDPVFVDPELGVTFAELEPAEKDARSHRGKAFRALAAWMAGQV